MGSVVADATSEAKPTLVDRPAIEAQLGTILASATEASDTTTTLMTLRHRLSDREGQFVVQLHRSARGLKAAAQALLNELTYQKL